MNTKEDGYYIVHVRYASEGYPFVCLTKEDLEDSIDVALIDDGLSQEQVIILYVDKNLNVSEIGFKRIKPSYEFFEIED